MLTNLATPESMRVDDDQSQVVAPALSIDVAIYLAIASVALLVRLLALGVAPLNSLEARQAIAAYNFSQGAEFTFAGSPLLFIISTLFFALFTASDFTARLAPALAGTALVLLPLLFRRDLGRTGAIISTALLAFSPSLILFSRTLDSAVPAVAASLALVGCGSRYLESPNRRDLFMTIFCAALVLLSLPDLNAGGSLLDVARLLVVYDPIVTLFGIAAIIDFILVEHRVNRRLMFVFAIWAAVAFILIAPSVQSSSVVFVVVPLAMLGGASIGGWVERTIEQVRELGARELLWHETPILGVSVGLVSCFLIGAVAKLAQGNAILTTDLFARLLGSLRDNPALDNAIAISLFLSLFLLTVILALTILGMARARNLGTFFVLGLLLAWTFRQAMMLNFTDNAAYNPQEWIVTRAASPNVRDLVSDLESQSRWRANDSHALVVQVDSSLGPIVQWNLRDFRFAQFAARPTLDPGTQAVVSAVGAPAPPGAWIAQRYQLELTRGVEAGSRLRALIYRDVGLLDSTDAILWVPRP